MQKTLDTIFRPGVIAILRGDFRGREEEVAGALRQGGILALELTLNSPGALESLGRLVRRWDSQLALGAGTVLRPEKVRQVADLGARFVVSPHRDPRVIEAALQLGLVSIPGAFTPSEIWEARQAGAHAVKLFPASCLGPAFVSALQRPLPEIPLVPTGGVDPRSASDYLAAGAWAVAVGSELVGAPSVKDPDLEELTRKARAFVQAVQEGRARRRPSPS